MGNFSFSMDDKFLEPVLNFNVFILTQSFNLNVKIFN